MIRDQSVQISDPDHSFREPAPDQDPAVSVLQIHVVMGLSPVVADEQHQQRSLAPDLVTVEPEGGPRRANGSVLEPVARRHAIPPVVSPPGSR